MGRLGADADGLDTLATEMEAGAREIATTATRLDRLVRSSDWQGRDADDFRRQWRRHDSVIRSAAGQLRQCSTNLRGQAQSQRIASNATDGALFCPAPPSPLALLNGTSMPLSIEEFAGEARVSAEFLAVTGDISARIEDYPGPHSLVTVGSGIGAHLTAGAGEGISVDLGDSEVGSASAASISAGIVGGTSHAWVVRDSRANATLRDRAIDHLARSASNNIGAQNPIAGAISRKLTDTIVGWETPDATTTYAGLVVAASAFATSGIAGIQSSGKLSTVIATNELRNGRRSYSLTTEGAGSAGIPLGLLGVPADNTSITGAYRSVLSIGTPQNGRIPVVVQHYAESDGRVVMGSNSVVLSQERLGTSIDDVVRQITRGGLEGAAAALKSGVVEVGETQVHRGELLSDDYGLKASAAHVGLAITGTNRSVEFSPVEAAGKPGP